MIEVCDSDFLLVEGMKGLAIPRFWCVGEETPDEAPPPGTVAVVAWKEPPTPSNKADVPVLPSGDVENLVTVVEREALDVSELVL